MSQKFTLAQDEPILITEFPKKLKEVKEQLQFVAWRDFLVYCIGEPEILLRYERDTGERILQQMFYDVVSNNMVTTPGLVKFTIWATKVYWGEADAPPEYHELVKRNPHYVIYGTYADTFADTEVDPRGTPPHR